MACLFTRGGTPRAFSLLAYVLCVGQWWYSLEQITDASSLCPQFSTPHPLWKQPTIDLSFPEQNTSSNQIGPLPRPKCAPCGALTASGYPSSRQTTLASLISQLSSQTVPQAPLWKISTLPAPRQFPPTNLKPKTKRKYQVAYWPLINSNVP